MHASPITASERLHMRPKRFFHGSNAELTELQAGSYVTKSVKDACKFGYRKAVMTNSPYVYIYLVDCSDIVPDKNRNRAYTLNKPCKALLITRYNTYETPYKLKNFKLQT